MTIVDHRILIPRPPGLVWEFISDLNRNPEWIVDCTRIAFVTPRHSGVGVRWRHTTERGKDVVLETTAWYDGLGYEYTFVDGAPYKESKGRVRLQETPEGTVVQWTFTYETGGLLANVKNAVSDRRRIDSQIVDSLKNLWRATGKLGGEAGYAARSLMRDAPDYEARSQYKPRHGHSRMETQETLPVSPLVIEEPPVKQEDTRPRPAIQISADQGEPPFLSDLKVANPGSAMADSEVSAPPIIEKLPVTASLASTAPLPEVPMGSSQPVEIDPALSVKDTAEVSVFDLFGIPRPSQTQQMAAITAEVEEAIMAAESASKVEDNLAAPAASTLFTPTDVLTVPIKPVVVTGSRAGYRKSKRRQRIRLRLPS
ncbi:MAG: SRPBCC family protein [Anaerolineae bacterium]|nr:SRPBCC family protein [Anaerolineae bacterium]